MPKLGQRIPCPHCSETFTPKRKEQRFCSRACAYEGRKAESAARFWERVTIPDDTACHLYTGPLGHKGHGRVWWLGRTRPAHQIAWELANGPIPPGLCVLHNCPGGDNPACVNVRHLWLGDKAANNADRDAKGRTARGDRSGSRLHPERRVRGEAMPHAKLREEDVRAIRQCVAGGDRQVTLARRFGISKHTVSMIVGHKAWRHVA